MNCVNSGITEFNIAGGEPFVYPYFDELVEFINDCGASCSVITNGSLITRDWIKSYGRKINTLGVSIDSINNSINANIGRETVSGKQLDTDYIKECLCLLKDINPNCSIKINTVVSKLNYSEYMYDFILKCKCDRWKLLRMHIFNDGIHDNSSLSITDGEYEIFVKNNISNYSRDNFDSNQNRVLKTDDGVIIVLENDMESAYIIIDSRGFLVDNVDNKYTDVINCTKESFTDGLNKMIFNDSSFWSRYELSE